MTGERPEYWEYSEIQTRGIDTWRIHWLSNLVDSRIVCSLIEDPPDICRRRYIGCSAVGVYTEISSIAIITAVGSSIIVLHKALSCQFIVVHPSKIPVRAKLFIFRLAISDLVPLSLEWWPRYYWQGP